MYDKFSYIDDFVAFFHIFQLKSAYFGFLPGNSPKMIFFENFLRIIDAWVEMLQKRRRSPDFEI